MHGDDPQLETELAHPELFRAPTVREHRIAAALFVGFAVAFFMLFVVLQGWWFRWVIAGMGVWSLVVGVQHARDARAARGAGRR